MSIWRSRTQQIHAERDASARTSLRVRFRITGTFTRVTHAGVVENAASIGRMRSNRANAENPMGNRSSRSDEDLAAPEPM